MLAERQMHLADQQRELESQQLAFENQVTRERRGLAGQAEESRTAAEQRSRDLDRREQGLDPAGLSQANGSRAGAAADG